jgi:catechol 2,3-dioxygenase-like lactoylglutathione lyase family enzyme
MILKHLAIVCSSESGSDRFFSELLGLQKLNTKMLSAELSKQIFNSTSEYKLINYAGAGIHFEIFIGPVPHAGLNKIDHVCLEVEDLESFLKKCRSMDINISLIPKGDSTLTFIRDDDGNLFEIKGQKQLNPTP